MVDAQQVFVAHEVGHQHRVDDGHAQVQTEPVRAFAARGQAVALRADDVVANPAVQMVVPPERPVLSVTVRVSPPEPP